MQTFERTMTLEGKKAHYYDLSTLASSDTNILRPAAHFYGGNGFTVASISPY